MRSSIAFSARPRATDVNSFPPRIRFSPNRASKIFLTARTNEEPPVRNTISTSFGCTPDERRRESTHPAICPSSSEIHSSKDARSTTVDRSTKPSENRNVVTGALEKLAERVGFYYSIYPYVSIHTTLQR